MGDDDGGPLFATDQVARANALAARRFLDGSAVRIKSDGTYVTDVEVEVEAFLRGVPAFSINVALVEEGEHRAP